jgi:hypothetical protein
MDVMTDETVPAGERGELAAPAPTAPAGPVPPRSARHHRDTSRFRHSAQRTGCHQPVTPAIKNFSVVADPWGLWRTQR